MTGLPTRLPVGLHTGLSEQAYHADPAEAGVSVSSSTLRTLVEQSPEHAWFGHPRLNPFHAPRKATEAMVRGTILHALMLGTPAPFRILHVADYKTAAAREQRDACLRDGLIPLKAETAEELRDVASSLRGRLAAMPEVWAAMRDAVNAGMIEVTLIWRERGVLCRCRYDILPAARFGVSYDLKFTGLSAEPAAAGKRIVADYAYQADLYPRAVKALRGDRPEFAFVAVEDAPPYGVTLHALAPDASAMAREKVDAALALWERCLHADEWPSYPAQVHYHDLPGWIAREWDDRQLSAQQIASRTWGVG